MARRTGLATIRALALRMCRLIGQFDPIIRAVYGDNPDLIIALETALSACQVLVAQADESLPQGD